MIIPALTPAFTCRPSSTPTPPSAPRPCCTCAACWPPAWTSEARLVSWRSHVWACSAHLVRTTMVDVDQWHTNPDACAGCSFAWQHCIVHQQNKLCWEAPAHHTKPLLGLHGKPDSLSPLSPLVANMRPSPHALFAPRSRHPTRHYSSADPQAVHLPADLNISLSDPPCSDAATGRRSGKEPLGSCS